jgi:hypothetical protein
VWAVLALAAALPLVAQAGPDSRVVRDAETGQLRAPNAAEARALDGARTQTLRGAATRSATLATADAAPQERVLDNGAVAMDLDESSLLYAVVRRNPDGTLSRMEVQGKATAQQLVTKAPKSFAKPIAPAKTTTKEGGYELK